MIPQHIKEQVLWVINDPDIWASVKILLQHRIDDLRIKNDNAVGDEVQKNQGAIRELKMLMNVREAVVAEHKKGGAANGGKG